MRDVHRLRVLVEIADRGSMSAAARALSFSQPAVSRQIEALEHEVGAQLVQRLGRGVRLTEAGLLLADRSREILSQLDAVQRELHGLNGLRCGRLRFGGFASANALLVPASLARFAERYPGVRISLSGATTRHHAADLRSGLLDIALLTGWDLTDEELGGLEIVPLLEDEVFVALSRERPSAHGEFSPYDLAEESWIEGAHPDCLGPRPEFSHALGFDPRIHFRVADRSAVDRLVELAAGVTLIPGLAAARSDGRVVLHSLDGLFPPRRVYIALPEGHPSPAAEPLIDMLLGVARTEGALLSATVIN